MVRVYEKGWDTIMVGKWSAKKRNLRSLEHGQGIPYLLNKGYEILGNPIMTHDMEFKVIAYTENILTDDLIWNEYVRQGRLDHFGIEFLKDERFLDAAANVEKITMLYSEKLKYDRVLGKLFNRDHIQIGAACMPACERPFKESDIELFEMFCDILNAELADSDFYLDYGQAYMESLLGRLTQGSIQDKRFYSAHVESIYASLKSKLYLAVVARPTTEPDSFDLRSLRDLLKQTQNEFKYYIYEDYILIVISTNHVKLSVKRDLLKLADLFQQYGLRAGISSAFDNLFELHKYYREALDALVQGQTSSNDQNIFIA